MKYVGIQTQQSNNNFKSVLLLILFPIVTLALVFLFLLIFGYLTRQPDSYGQTYPMFPMVWTWFLQAIPGTLIALAAWFGIAYLFHSFIIQKATGSKPLERKENMRVYNLVENLCMSRGMKMPKVNVINDSSLNAFASGISDRTYTVTLTTGIIQKLNDAELEGVIAHELSHIRNRDVRLMIISIVFVGIFSLIAQIAFNAVSHARFSSDRKNGQGTIVILIAALLIAAVGYLITTLMKFAISRKREYLADAGAAEWTKNPQALASALRKIAIDPRIEAVSQKDVAQLFIEHPLEKTKHGFTSLFATHPPIQSRIAVLEQF